MCYQIDQCHIEVRNVPFVGLDHTWQGKKVQLVLLPVQAIAQVSHILLECDKASSDYLHLNSNGLACKSSSNGSRRNLPKTVVVRMANVIDLHRPGSASVRVCPSKASNAPTAILPGSRHQEVSCWHAAAPLHLPPLPSRLQQRLGGLALLFQESSNGILMWCTPFADCNVPWCWKAALWV